MKTAKNKGILLEYHTILILIIILTLTVIPNPNLDSKLKPNP